MHTDLKANKTKQKNNYPRLGKDICLGLYDFNPEANVKTWLITTINILQKFGLEPTKLDIAGENAGKNGKTLTFKSGWALLEKYNFKGFESIAIIAYPSYTQDIYLAHVGCNFKFSSDPYFDFSIDEALIGGWNQEIINDIYTQYSQILKPKYGFCTSLSWQKGPSFYVAGITYSLLGAEEVWSGEEAKEIRYWGINYHNFYKTGDFRDIYEINYIGPEHLSMNISESRRLSDIIGKDPGWGSIKQLAEGVYSWHLTTEEAHILRQKLAPTGRILALKKPGS
jgi:hypothetical protein